MILEAASDKTTYNRFISAVVFCYITRKSTTLSLSLSASSKNSFGMGGQRSRSQADVDNVARSPRNQDHPKTLAVRVIATATT